MKFKNAQIMIQGREGRMGSELEKLLRSNSSVELVSGPLKNVRPGRRSVVIDFSSPKGMRVALAWCVKNKTPLVSGTTGLTSADERALMRASKKIPVLWSANMSVGINIFLKLIGGLGNALQQFDLQIEEVHHAQKKDAPSGTAKILQAEVERVAKIKMPPILSGRGGGVIGVHKLLIMAEEEVLTIEHTAINRAVFARGALAAAQWILQKKAGRYSMQDVLGE